VTAIRYSLDNGTDMPPCTPHSLCEALVSFLQALPQPLLPPESYPSVRSAPKALDARSICRVCCVSQ
jgi:hypothetical protein